MGKQVIKIHNKSDKPDNIVMSENSIVHKCIMVENSLPSFMKDYFLYLKNAVAIRTRLAYLQDLYFFCSYLINYTGLTNADTPKNITLTDFKNIKSKDINRYLGEFCARYEINRNEDEILVMENHSKSLARKRSSISVLFKYLYREELLPDNITEGFNPIKLPKPQPDAIKRLDINEVSIMLDTVINGTGLSDKERDYWKKTKLRDKAIIVLFVTYGLRLNELFQLNISSFNFSRGEFKIYRKRGKESLMPLNNSVETAIKDYINKERPKNEQIPEAHRDALFLSMQNSRLAIRSIRELVKKYTSIAMGTSKDKGYSPHKLRATAATSLIQTGFSIYDVQSLLDHENVTTTQLYSAHRKDAKREIVKNFEWLEDKKMR